MGNNTNGLAEKLQKILNTYSEDADRFQKELDYLRQRAMFCHEHKFEEEKRITLVKTQQTEMLLYSYQSMIRDVNELLNDWNS